MSLSKSATGLTTGTTHPLRFAVGQLACAAIGMTEGTNEANFIGRVQVIEEGNVRLRAYDGEEVEVPLASLKQAVHYDTTKANYVALGARAEVFAIDHPGPGIFENEHVYTSTVLKHNPFTGFFETRNTVYMSNVIRHPMFGDKGEMKSPYLYAGK